MKRDRGYYRDVRKRKIAHRKRLCLEYLGEDWYSIDGKYDKGKIHCSCPLCKAKSKNLRYSLAP